MKSKIMMILYAIAGIAYVPLVGIPFGFVALLAGLIVYRSEGRRLFIMALCSPLPTVISYGLLISLSDCFVFKYLEMKLDTRILSESIPEIEMHRLKKGEYPAKIQDVEDADQLRHFIYKDGNLRSGYYYDRVAGGYVIGHIGPDSLKGTNDDIRPVLNDTIGLGVRNATLKSYLQILW